ncbi:MAG: sigma-54 factor interaction domain-containing protein, partial [Leptospiraceae bacterium]|nr:sigma-54 factor interaction domain-containing protein [Leptospiraceae bacterium]
MRLVRKLEELIEINSLISSALDRDSILKSITLSTLALLDTHGAEIWLLESSAPAPSAQSESEENATDYNGLLVGGPHKFQLVACAGTGEALATLPHMELPAGCIQFHEQQPFIENRDVLRKSMAQALGEADIFNGSVEAAFFAFGSTVRQVGLFTVHRLQARTFQQEDHYFLERLAIQAGISLHNSARYERVKTERDRAVTENRALKKDRVIVGHSRAIQELRDLIQQVAPAQAPVLLIGERGTGKELVAEAIHRESTRADRPLVRINCGGMVESLLESELFGYEKGAFTGADKARAGLLEEAHTGTLFLDEIGEMPASMQVRLLRFLQEGTTRRVGGNRERKLDVRVIAATNRDVSADPGLMRRDLYDRLATVVLR